MTSIHSRVLIAGSGPVGLVAAYALVQEGIPVTVFEENGELQEDPRAATTHPATLELLAKLGVVEMVTEQGLVCPTFQFWDRPTGEMVAEFDHSLLSKDTDFPYVVQCEQFKLARILTELITDTDGADILFSHRLTSVSASEDNVTVTVDAPDGKHTYKGAYLIGADGGRSTVRKQMDIPFEGFTWPERFLVLSTPFDFEAECGMSYRNYIADPEEWCNCFKVAGDGPPGLWRTVYPEDPEALEEDLLADDYVERKLQGFFPAGEPYDIVHRNLYTIHQRVAATFRRGRVLIAGDAAHVNNSIGGMGLNGGIQDAMNLVEKLVPVWKGEANAELLDMYDTERRTFAVEFVQEQSIQNKKRLEAKNPESRAAFLKNLRETAAEPARARKFMLKSSMIEAMRAIGAGTNSA